MNKFEQKFNEKTNLVFSKFYAEQLPKLIFFLNGWTKDTKESEDLAVESFLRFLDKIGEYDGGQSQAHTWLFSIARNMCINKFKDDKRLQVLSMDRDVNTNTHKTEDTKISLFLRYDDAFERNAEIELETAKAKIVRDAIHNLPIKQKKYKDILILREIELMSYEEIKQRLDINLSNVKNQIKKGREILRKNTKSKIDILYTLKQYDL